MTQILRAHFTRLMLEGCDRLQKEIGYRPARFRQMVAADGGVATAKKLVHRKGYSDGFVILMENDRLDLSMEAFMLLPQFATIFSADDLATARNRLESVGFDVDQFLMAMAP